MSSSELVNGPCPILVNRTQFVDAQVRGVDFSSNYPVLGFLRPTCGRFVVQYRGRGRSAAFVEGVEPFSGRVDFETGEVLSDTIRRSGSRRRSSIGDFCAHNSLGYLLTLTFRDEPSSVGFVWHKFELFVRRLRLSVGVFPYVGVLERGDLGRLHLHVVVGRWYVDRSACVRCLRCVLPSWKWFSAPPSPDALCLGCLWGLGIVSGPSELFAGEVRANGDPRRAAMYVSKYVSKDLLQELGKGRQLYRVAKGFQAPVFKLPGFDVSSVVSLASERVSAASGCDVSQVVLTALHEVVHGWPGRPTWVGFVPLAALPAVP